MTHPLDCTICTCRRREAIGRETTKPALALLSLVKHRNQAINHSLFTDIGRYAVSIENGEPLRITMHWHKARERKDNG